MLESISFEETNFFSKLICDYLAKKNTLAQFYNNSPRLDNFKEQIKEKHDLFDLQSRDVLYAQIKQQYEGVDISEKTYKNIESLKQRHTYTIATGHQLNLFTGPLYFLYKIISAINLSSALKKEFPDNNFVPVYWMATEDHDFAEINYFNFKEKKIRWDKSYNGAVGDMPTKDLDEVLNELEKEFGNNINAKALKLLFKQAYLEHANLADATRFLVNKLFKDYGLVIIDANNANLKKQFIPFIKDELLNKTSYKYVTKTNEKLKEKGYKIQVNPREINLFYLNKNLRERIVFEDNVYKVLNTSISWRSEEIEKELLKHPERFSPNVILRPLYQEVILPNLCYIGGGGELAYWFQLKQLFDKVNVPFPILQLRSSVLIQTKKQSTKLDKLNISTRDVFLKRDLLINKKVREISNINIDLSMHKTNLIKEFKSLYELARQTDKTFINAVKTEELKQLKGFDRLEKRLLKAQKKKLVDQISRMAELHAQLFPNGSLQERTVNFSEFYLEYGRLFIPKLVENLQPLKNEFFVLTI